MNAYKWWMIFLVTLICLSSCWDRRLLKDHSLILAIGYDINEDDTISKTVSFPHEQVYNSSTEGVSNSNEVITTVGNTVGDADLELERVLSQKFDRSKARILLIGESLAKYGMFPTLDSMYRDSKGPLNASIAIVSERAEDGLKIHKDHTFFTSEFYYDMMKSAEDSGLIKQENVQSICPIILSGRKDIALPLIQVVNEEKAIIDGMALFNGDKMTGKIDRNESIMLIVLLDSITKNSKLSLKITDDKEKREKNYVTFSIRKEKRKLTVQEENMQVKVDMALNLKLEVEEYPEDHLYQAHKIDHLEEAIEAQLNSLIKQTITSIQEANSDVLGIGERLRAFHYPYWQTIEWDQVYPTIPIEVDLSLEITRHGVMN